MKNFIAEIISSILVSVLLLVFANWKRIELLIQSLLIKRNKLIRVSIHAILKVEKNGEYLLIRNWSRPDTYAPIGGAYKYHSTAKSFFNEISFEPQGGVSPHLNVVIRPIFEQVGA